MDRAEALKAAPRSSRALDGAVVALLFEKPSTRTRVSFEAGIVELGGHPMVLRAGELQLRRGESPGDTARVLSRHVRALGVRTHEDAL
ncbi:MAG TPA: ornithine carbamoyltransferase, partial [Solirubrobacteraceae bacterium]|nr:ornithine carbamoyltransferase [Solirubrobacteraceae bacterium]